MDKVLTRLEDAEKLKRGERIWPKFAGLHISNHCNMNCKGCAYKNKLDNKMMSEKNREKIIEDLLDIGVQAFDFSGGGEPLMLPYIEKMWDKIVKANCNYGLITNGSLLTERHIEALVKNATYIRISLEASNPEDYAGYKMVDKNTWFRVIDNIIKLVKARNKTDSKLEIALKFVVGKSLRGFKHYVDGFNLGIKLGVDNIQFKALRHKPEELCYTDKIVENRISKSVLDKVKRIEIRNWIIPSTYIPQCWLTPLHTVIDHNGDVYLCCYYYYRGNEHLIGNMLKESFKDFWLGDRHRELIIKIDKRKCSQVDCRFFRHHQTIEEAMINGKGYWL